MNKKILSFLSIVLVFIFILTVNADTAVSNVAITPTGTKIIDKGEELQLGATITPEDATNKNVSWTSSIPTVATVDSTGKVTGVEYGSTVITVTSESEGHTDDKIVLVRPKIRFDANGGTLHCDNGSLPNDNPDRPLNPGTFSASGVTHYYVDAAMDKDYNVYQLFTDTTGVHCTMTYPNHRFLGWYNDPSDIRLEETATFATAKALSNSFVAHWEDQSVEVSSLELTSSTLNTSVGKAETIGVIIKPSNATNKDLNISFSTSGIATVTAADSCPVSFMGLADGGVVNCYNVTGVSEGNTSVTFTAQDGSKSDKSVTVTVNVAAATVPVESIAAYPKNIDLAIKTTDGAFTTSETIGIIVTPRNATNRNLNVVSVNTNVATVTESSECPVVFMNMVPTGGIVYCYNVTAMAPGTTQIKVKLADGSLAEQVINVNVKEYVPITSVSVVQESITIAPNKYRTLQPIMLPSNATNQNITWTSSNESVAVVMKMVSDCVTVSSGAVEEDSGCVSDSASESNVNDKAYVLKALAKGTTTLTATTEDGSKVATVQVTVNDTVDESTITYDCNSGNGTMPSFTISKNDKYKLDKSICTKEGYTFKGWKIYSNSAVLKDSSSKDYEYTDEEVFTNIFGSEKPNLSLKAVWVSKTVPNAKTGISKPIYALLTLAMISLIVFIAVHSKKVDF